MAPLPVFVDSSCPTAPEGEREKRHARVLLRTPPVMRMAPPGPVRRRAAPRSRR